MHAPAISFVVMAADTLTALGIYSGIALLLGLSAYILWGD